MTDPYQHAPNNQLTCTTHKAVLLRIVLSALLEIQHCYTHRPWTVWSPILWTFQHAQRNDTRRVTSKPSTLLLPYFSLIYFYVFPLLLFVNLLTCNDDYSGRTAPLTSKCCILYIYSTDIGTKYFKHVIYSPFFPLQNAVCFIILTYFIPVLFTFYIQGVLKLKT